MIVLDDETTSEEVEEILTDVIANGGAEELFRLGRSSKIVQLYIHTQNSIRFYVGITLICAKISVRKAYRPPQPTPQHTNLHWGSSCYPYCHRRCYRPTCTAVG